MTSTNTSVLREFLWLGFVAVISLVLVCLYYRHNEFLFVLLSVTAFVTVYGPVSRRGDWSVFITCAVGGPVAEAVAIHYGAWEYASTAMAATPVGYSGMLSRRCCRMLEGDGAALTS